MDKHELLEKARAIIGQEIHGCVLWLNEETDTAEGVIHANVAEFTTMAIRLLTIAADKVEMPLKQYSQLIQITMNFLLVPPEMSANSEE